jgi:hypothetical protein
MKQISEPPSRSLNISNGVKKLDFFRHTYPERESTSERPPKAGEIQQKRRISQDREREASAREQYYAGPSNFTDAATTSRTWKTNKKRTESEVLTERFRA